MKAVLRLAGLLLLAAVLLQLVLLAQVAAMRWIDPPSTTFQRSEALRILKATGRLPWRQEWVPYAQLPASLKRAVIAAEDADFAQHGGVEWEAMRKAWDKNARAEAAAEKRAQQAAQAAQAGRSAPKVRGPKIVGGSTITQQLAKNLLLSGERTLPRKAQELLLALALEALLPKERILEIYLNSVEWGEGVFGAEAAAQHYFKKPAARLSPYESARLAVMLPRPKFYEKLPGSGYLAGRAATIAARAGDVALP